jgi:polyphosphate kinase 2 (PPK2 family)
MLELLNLDQKISKEDYARTFPELEERLGQCQRAARAAGIPVIIVCEGWDAAGKGTVINRLAAALDPRGFQVHLVGPANEVDRWYPWPRRFWNALPADGLFAIFDHSWYRRVLADRIDKAVPAESWRGAYEEILELERTLCSAGAVIVKLWMHIDKAEQKRRFRRLTKHSATAWKVAKPERTQHRRWAQWLPAVEEMLERTGTAAAPWTVVEATQARFARVKIFRTVVEAVEAEVARRGALAKPKNMPMPLPPERPAAARTILDGVDLSLALEREEYEARLAELQQRMFHLEHELYLARIPAVIAYEGWDAAGKGGNIRRLTESLDPRGYRVVPVGAPSREELAHHYLWRFWPNIPKAGHIAIFDRTWYGRVLVERVEGFCSEDEWKRSYREINEFERQLTDFGTVVVKFWLQIDSAEQLRRFQERQATPYKQWKITDEDWRNREKWPQYQVAVLDMLEKTSTSYAPWTILESNCKLHARIKALQTVAAALEKALGKAKIGTRKGE